MTYQQLRATYPKFVYDSFSNRLENGHLTCDFNYSLPPDHHFTHTVTFENFKHSTLNINHLEKLVFNLGIAEMFSYWKLTCSPLIDISNDNSSMTNGQINFWKKLLIRGMGQYFYENQIDFTPQDFLTIRSHAGATRTGAQEVPPEGKATEHLQSPAPNAQNSKVLVPLGGGKDSIVTLELLKPRFNVIPIIVEPTTPASHKIVNTAQVKAPIIVRRKLDPQLLQLNKQGYLNGHIPYSAVLAFIFLLAASVENIPYIAVSNEKSSDEGNVNYLDSIINHQYSKTAEFESDFNEYIKHLTSNIKYFSFLRPLYDLQIAKLFSRYPQYFPIFRSCNIGRKGDSWCGRCPKCISTAMTLTPWISPEQVTKFIGSNPLSDPANQQPISRMTDPQKTKPFECIVSIDEAQVCLEFINQGQTDRVVNFLNGWGPSAMPSEFFQILKKAYDGA